MSFKTFDKKLFKIYTKIWKRISDLVGKELHNKLYYEGNKNNIRYINSKINIINDEIKTNFHNNVEQKQKVAYDYFSLIDLNSILRKNDDTCCLQVYLEDCQHRIKKKKKKRCLNKVFATDLSDNQPSSGTDSEPDSDADDNNESETSSKKSDSFVDESET